MKDTSANSKRHHVATAYLRELRVVGNRTQAEVAADIERLQTFVSDIEKNRRVIGLIQSLDFCEALGISFSEFAKELERRIQELPPEE
jgi:transcriptional regulator with XRE-family HTH domain